MAGSTNLAKARYGYDAASQVSTVSDGTDVATYWYLANSALVGQISFAHNGTTEMTTVKTYDNLNRLTGIVSGNGTIPAVDSRSYAYNSANQRTNMTEVDGSYWNYGYDSLGQVTNGIKHWSGGTPVAGQQFGYAFDTIGNRLYTQSGGDATGANLRLAYYTNRLLNQITSRGVPAFVDVMGLTQAGTTVQVNGTNAYQINQYFREQMGTNNGSTYGAQWVGINVTATGQATVSGHAYLAQNPENYSYDADGNLLSDGRWSYAWDGENRLISMTSLSNAPTGSSNQLTFTYDYRSRRIQKAVYAWGSAVSTNGYTNYMYTNIYTNTFLYDGWNLVATLNTASSLQNSYLWGTDLSGSMQGAGGVSGLLAENIVSNGVEFAAHDGNGNVVALVNATTGAATANYEYGPFGEVIRATGPMAKLNPFRFSTKYQDDETDFLYYGYRYYNPSTGRWLSRDPMTELAFNHQYFHAPNQHRRLSRVEKNALVAPYVFALNEPPMVIDPDGRNPVVVVTVIVGTVAIIEFVHFAWECHKCGNAEDEFSAYCDACAKAEAWANDHDDLEAFMEVFHAGYASQAIYKCAMQDGAAAYKEMVLECGATAAKSYVHGLFPTVEPPDL